ncbi:DUF1853 family protein [Vibrio sp. 10N.261.51.F12]|uniref:DUF1853 family protein n=1 Tax=Vibrio sp. 10N.261.51.F12 TaxID=3229679 RepID=UPI00354E102F
MTTDDLNEFTSWISTSTSLVFGDPRIAIRLPTKVDHSLSKSAPYKGNPRLGFLYQELCRRQFEQHPNYTVLAEEIQLQEGKRTLGAIDFLLQNQRNGDVEHWEVAIKFYLLKDGQWFGPNAKDRLDLKLSRMMHHQLMMSDTLAFQEQFPNHKPANKHLLMQGRLYINPFDCESVPTQCLELDIDTANVSGRWCYQKDIHKLNEPMYVLPKHRWATGFIDGESAMNKKPEALVSWPGHFVHCQSESGVFWFIVPNDWPQSSM